MYCEYYGFREKPFNITPDPGFIFLSTHHKEAFAHLLYGIDSHVGFLALTGEVGTGKTTVIRTLLGQLDPAKYRTAIIFNPCLSSLGLMQHINREYGLPAESPDTADLLQELNRFLLTENGAGRTVILVVDEAQNLSPSVLEQVRLISNLETERDKLIQIVLVGQPELKEMLQRHELRQLGQRVAVSYHLQPMDFDDTREYILHRLQVADRRDSSLFSQGALRHMFTVSGGVPRVINLVADRALLLGYTVEKEPISRSMAVTASKDLGKTGNKGHRIFWMAPLAAAVTGIVVWAATSGNFVAPVQHHSPVAPKPAAAAPAIDIGLTAARELGALSEAETISRTYQALAREWGIPAVPIKVEENSTVENVFGKGGFEYTRFSGNISTLLRINFPAVLDLVLPGVQGSRHAAITGRQGQNVVVTPAIGGKSVFSPEEIDRIWSGRAVIPWKNHLGIRPGLRAPSQGPTVARLQELLVKSGTYRGPVNGIFDKTTEDAVMQFQLKSRLEGDGKAGRQTLQMLYPAAGYAAPTLTKEKLQ